MRRRCSKELAFALRGVAGMGIRVVAVQTRCFAGRRFTWRLALPDSRKPAGEPGIWPCEGTADRRKRMGADLSPGGCGTNCFGGEMSTLLLAIGIMAVVLLAVYAFR